MVHGALNQVHQTKEEKLEEHDSSDKNTTKVTQTRAYPTQRES